MAYYIIYKTTNLVNGKMYIGQHRTENIDDGYLGSGVLLRRAIKKYGEQNFKREILCFCDSPEQLNEMEAKYVDDDWMNREDTYNLKTGGDQNSVFSEESKLKKSRTMKGRPNGRLGTKHSEETKRRISASLKGNPNLKTQLGKKHTEEYKERMRKYRTGKRMSEETKQKLRDYWTGVPRTEEQKEKQRKAMLGMRWWNNGKINIRARECPEGFVRGRC